MPIDPQPDNATDLQQRLDCVLQQQRSLLDGLKQGQSRFKSLARSVWRVQEQEQRKLARELHDGIGQNLGAIANLIERAQRSHAPEALAQAHTLALSTLDETRVLSRLLRPQILDDLGVAAALRWLARNMGEAHAIDIQLHVPEPFPDMNEEFSTLVFRIVQEALTNAVKHAHAQHVTISIENQAHELKLQVRDDGCGCDPSLASASGTQGKSSGLGGMRDRVGLYDGGLEIESAPGRGLRLLVTIPMPHNGAFE